VAEEKLTIVLEPSRQVFRSRRLPLVQSNRYYLKKPIVYAMNCQILMPFLLIGVDTRSLCTVTCKWTFASHNVNSSASGFNNAQPGWSKEYFESIGLQELLQDGCIKIGSSVGKMGAPLGAGLTNQAALDLGLKEGIPVGVGIIDAHAGGIGTHQKIFCRQLVSYLLL
jgi:ribulose kinase